jgi:hypothetical protein
LFEAALITFQRSRVIVKIFTFAKLRRVHEYAYDNALCILAGEFDQGDMPGMKIPHRGHQGNVRV